MQDSCCLSKTPELEQLAQYADQRRILFVILTINAVMFFFEFGAGIAAGSNALMADATDMLGDALVYGVSIYALTRNDRWKAGAALFKGLFILAMAAGIVVNVLIKLRSGVPPSSTLMLAFGGLAFGANLICFGLPWRFRTHDVNMASSFECSRNDLASNLGVIAAGVLVGVLASPWPDIVIGSVMALLFLRSALRVITEAVRQLVTGSNVTESKLSSKGS